MKEHSSGTSAVSMVEIFADGMRLGKAVVKPEYPYQLSGSWVDEHTLRPFIFTDTKSPGRSLFLLGVNDNMFTFRRSERFFRMDKTT